MGVERIEQELRAADAQAALLSSFEDVCYATGFEVPPPIDAGAAFAYGPTLALVAADGGTRLIVPGSYAARVREQSRADDTVMLTGFGHFEHVDGRAEFLGAIADALADAGLDGAGRLAIDARTLPAEVADLLRGTFEGMDLIDAGPLLRRARSRKTAREVQLLRAAARVADAGQEALLRHAHAGRNEIEVMGDVLTAVDRAAGGPTVWAGELVTGPRTGVVSYPGGPVDRELRAGDTALMDLSVRVRGYWADCTNVLVVSSTT